MRQFIVIVLSFTALPAFCQSVPDAVAEGLRGRVRTVTDIQYYDESMKRPFMKTVDHYDRRGYRTEVAHNDYVLKLNTHRFIKYDTNSNGSLARLQEFEGSRLVRSIIYTYDSAGRVHTNEDHSFFQGREVVYRHEYGYDSLGRKVSDRSFTNGKPGTLTHFTYDGKGRVATERALDRNDKPEFLTDYNYFAYDQWVNCERHASGTRLHIFRTIDTAGLIIEKTTYNGDFTKQTNETFLSFDKHGNWLKESVKGTITENYFVVRTIEYYK